MKIVVDIPVELVRDVRCGAANPATVVEWLREQLPDVTVMPGMVFEDRESSYDKPRWWVIGTVDEDQAVVFIPAIAEAKWIPIDELVELIDRGRLMREWDPRDYGQKPEPYPDPLDHEADL